MKTKYLLGVLVLIVAIGGVTACSILLPSGNTQTPAQSTPVATTAPAVDQPAPTPTEEQNTQPQVQAQKVTCTKCGGDGALSCGKCGGSGQVASGGGSCGTCGGDGQVYYDAKGVCHPNYVAIVMVLACHYADCPTCGGTGGGSQSGACSACGGDGAITCTKCGGSGYYYA